MLSMWNAVCSTPPSLRWPFLGKLLFVPLDTTTTLRSYKTVSLSSRPPLILPLIKVEKHTLKKRLFKFAYPGQKIPAFSCKSGLSAKLCLIHRIIDWGNFAAKLMNIEIDRARPSKSFRKFSLPIFGKVRECRLFRFVHGPANSVTRHFS